MSSEHITEFGQRGYTVIKDFLSEEETESLKHECEKIIENMVPSEHHSVFQTGKNQVGDEYFMNSGDKISFFFEKDAVNNNGDLIVSKAQALNKIGHALHWWNPVFKKITFGQKVKDLFIQLGYDDPRVVQSMYIFKHPGIGGEVVPHQDSTFLNTQPSSALGLWFPLEDVTIENGCLWFIPGSHKDPVYQRFVRNPHKNPLLTLIGDFPEHSDRKYEPLPAKKGDCVVIHGSVIHKSGKNMSAKSRPVYTFHVVESNAVYSTENWLQPTEKLLFPPLYDVQSETT